VPGAQSTALQLIGAGPQPDAADAAAASVLNQALAGVPGARLPAALRRVPGEASASLALGRSQASWVLRARVPAEATAAGIGALWLQLDAARGALLPAEELQRARSASLLALPADHDTNDAVSQRLARHWALSLPVDHLARWPRQLGAVQASALQQVARTYLDPQAVRLVLVGDPARLQAAVQSLRLGPVEVRDADGRLLLEAHGNAPLLPTSSPAPAPHDPDAEPEPEPEPELTSAPAASQAAAPSKLSQTPTYPARNSPPA